jgi:hypothetical protein
METSGERDAQQEVTPTAADRKMTARPGHAPSPE